MPGTVYTWFYWTKQPVWDTYGNFTSLELGKKEEKTHEFQRDLSSPKVTNQAVGDTEFKPKPAGFTGRCLRAALWARPGLPTWLLLQTMLSLKTSALRAWRQAQPLTGGWCPQCGIHNEARSHPHRQKTKGLSSALHFILSWLFSVTRLASRQQRAGFLRGRGLQPQAPPPGSSPRLFPQRVPDNPPRADWAEFFQIFVFLSFFLSFTSLS